MVEKIGYGDTETITRPNDITAYTAGDVIGPTGGVSAAIEFKPMGEGGRETFLMSLRLMIFDTGVISGETAYRLHLYDSLPPSALADNAPWDLPAGDRASYRGFIDIPAPTDLGSTLFAEVSGLNKEIKVPSQSLWGYLVTIAGYTPSALRQYRLALRSSLEPGGGSSAVGIVDPRTGLPVSYLPAGRAAAAASVPEVLSLEDQREARPNANYRVLSAAASTNGALISASARAVHKILGRTVRASSVFLKLYDKATAPTVGTDVPFETLEMVASSTFDIDLKGYALVNGLGIAMTTASADADTGALTAGDVTALNISYAV